MTTPFGYFDLLEAFPEPGCAVCRLLHRDVDRYLDTLLYEHTVDPITQNRFRASRGLCNEHSWQLTRYNNALAVAILYDAVLDEIMQISGQTPERPSGLARLRGTGTPLTELLAPQERCPACGVRDDAEKRYFRIISDHVTEERFGDALRQSSGFCLPHFRGAIRYTREPEAARQLIVAQSAHWSALKAELKSFMHKLDAHYQHEQIGTEATSWLRALAQIAGEKRSID